MIALTVGCGARPSPMPFEDWLRVGVDVDDEADAVSRQLVSGGFEETGRVASERFVALSFRRGDGRRAVRVVTRRGVVASLDSHEPDGVRTRHGAVRLAEIELPDGHDVHGEGPDLDGDGQSEIVVAREEEGRVCHAVLRIDAVGRASAVADDAAELASDGCVTGFEDADGDSTLEALVALRWPQLGLGSVPTVRAVLVLYEGAYRARGLPVVYLERERARRRRALETAHARLDVPEALRCAVELAALAHLDGAALPSQVSRFDAAMQGLVLTRRQLQAVRRARGWIARGWRSEGARDTPAVRSDGQEEEAGR